MILRCLFFLPWFFFISCATEPPFIELIRPKALPLALNDRFQIRKITEFFNEPHYFPITQSDAVNFERKYYNYGAISKIQFDELRGNYASFYWRTFERADITVRYEYYQSILGKNMQAMERYYPNAFGSYKSTFNIIGSRYLEFGKVVSWRILLIVNGKVVAFRQSFLWK